MRIYLTILSMLMLFFIHNVKGDGGATNNSFDALTILHTMHKDGLKFYYLNSYLGREKVIEIKFGNESSILEHWIKDLPLKVTTHGWKSEMKNNTNGMFLVNLAYIDLGGFNIITVDWSVYAKCIKYPVPAALTQAVGTVVAMFLERVVNVTGINSTDIHLIGHSLGAHIVGSCGSHFKPGKVGRITGLDAAAPGFETMHGNIPYLNTEDALFVDCIHTAGGSLGYSKSIGHADFFPNNGKAAQPGCHSYFNFGFLGCSHARAYELYIDSIYHRKSLIAVSCPSWKAFKAKRCKDNPREFMRHDTSTSARGNYFLRTQKRSPFSKNE